MNNFGVRLTTYAVDAAKQCYCEGCPLSENRTCEYREGVENVALCAKKIFVTGKR